MKKIRIVAPLAMAAAAAAIGFAPIAAAAPTASTESVGSTVVVALNAQLLRRLDLRPEASVRAVL